MFENFLRFHGPISPAYMFYPTASELVSYVRHTVPRSKYLVVVGGASYFRGAGQNPDELWTLELQRLLGDDYVVVNFAMDAAGVTSFASVAFQVLAQEYPRIAYITNASPVVVDALDGGEPYRYVFWDAYYKGLIPLPAPWRDRVTALAKEERKDRGGLELHLGKRIDQITYSCDLWTYIGYRYFFTVWSNGTADTLTSARHLYIDSNDPDLVRKQAFLRQDAEYIRISEAGNKDFSRKGFVQDKNGTWQLDASAFDVISQLSTSMYPANLRSKCYLVFVRANPYFKRAFTPDDSQRYDTVFREGQQAFERTGYKVVQLSDANFAPDDFLDGGHFMASGGRKVAKAVMTALKGADPAGQPP
jgi:hypothetical protein